VQNKITSSCVSFLLYTVPFCEDETLILHDMISSGADCLELDPGTPYENVRRVLEKEKHSAVLGMM